MTDRWIPRTLVAAYCVMLAVLGGFTWVAVSTWPGTVDEVQADTGGLVIEAWFEDGRLVVIGRDTSGHPLAAISVRGVAYPGQGASPIPLRFEREGDGRQQVDWPAERHTWRAELTARSGAKQADLTLVAP